MNPDRKTKLMVKKDVEKRKKSIQPIHGGLVDGGKTRLLLIE